MTDPDVIVIRPAFRDALAALQADYDARCETCAHGRMPLAKYDPIEVGVACGRFAPPRLVLKALDDFCRDWEARP